MELVIIFVVIFVIYGAGWIWQTINDIVRDVRRVDPGDGAAAAHVGPKLKLGGADLGQLRRVWTAFCEKRDGQMHDRAPFESPKVSYVHRTSRVLLSLHESGETSPAWYTQLTYTIAPGWAHRVEIFPQRADEGQQRLLRIEDLEIGVPDFDGRFVLKASDVAFLREWLDEPTRRALEDLRALLANDRILVSINSSRLLVRKEGVIAGANELDLFAELSDQLYDRILAFWQRAAGIEILDEEGTDVGAPMCQICGVEIPHESRVLCRKCRTPHHEDCWGFNGGCATYACGEKKYHKRG